MALKNIEIKLSDNVLWDFVCKTEDPTLDTLYHKEDVLGLLNDEKDIETDEEEKEEIQEVIDDVTKSECELFSFEKYNYSFHCYEVPYLYSFISDAGFSKALEEIEDDILDFVLWKFFESKNCSDLQKKCGFEVGDDYEIYELESCFMDRDYNSAWCDILDQFVTQEQFDEVAKDFRLRGF